MVPDFALTQLRAGSALVDIVDVDGELGRLGGPAPGDNALGADFREPLPPGSDWIAPGMHTLVTNADGSRSHVAIIPDNGTILERIRLFFYSGECSIHSFV